jgi:fucose permease
MLALAIAAVFHLWENGTPPADSGPRLRLPPPVIAALGIVTFMAFAAEGAVSDWSALYLATDKGWSLAAAAWGFIAFSVVMSAARLSGDRIVARLGPVKTLAFGGLVTAIGFLIVIAAPWPAAIASGFAIVALGVANMAPITFSAAARTPGVPASVGVAAVTTLGYGGFIIFPPILGFIAKTYGFAAAFSVVIVMALIITAIARVARR